MAKKLESLVKEYNIKDNNTILLKEDFSCEMAEVELNGKNIFTGNFWDYHTGCYGPILPKKYDWEGRSSFVNALARYIQDLGKKVSVKKKQYKYKD
jgi:hypothetical protein